MRRNSKASTPNQSMDMDPYSTSLLDELLQTHEWKTIDDIIKLTFRAMSDLINLHGTSIKDIKNLLVTRASKTQLTTGLSLKASVSDLSRAMTELSSGLDNKVSFMDMQSALRDYVNRTDMQEVLATRSIQEESRISVNRLGRQAQPVEITLLQARMDDFQRQISKKIASCVSLTQFQDLLNIVQQKANVSQINEALENKVSKQYLSTSLQKKLSKADVQLMIAKKADLADLEYIVQSLQSKVNLTTLEKLTQVIQNKADKIDLNHQFIQRKKIQYQSEIMKKSSKKSQYDNQIKQLQKELLNIRKEMSQSTKPIIDINKSLNQLRIQSQEQFIKIKNSLKYIQDQFNAKLKNQGLIKQLTNEINLRKRCEEKIYEQIDDVRRRAEQIGGTCLDKRQFIDFKSQIMGVIDDKIQAEEIQTAFNKFQAQINQKFSLDKQQTFKVLRNLQKSLSQQISLNTSDIAAINTILSKKNQKLDTSILEEAAKRTRREVEECRKTVDTLYTQIQTKIGITEYQSDLFEFRKRFDSIHRQISLKANIKDVCVLADSKPNIDDVNKALKQINSSLSEKISQGDLKKVIKDQSNINETLCSENIVGRWLWQTLDLKPGGLIPWQIQCANTVPDYFFWEKDKTSILVLVAGIYQLTACLFNQNGQPGIFVNGDLISGKSIDNIVKKTNNKRKKDKQTNGVKIQEFVMLPSRSRISVSSNIDGSEAFLNIRRL